MLLQKNPSSMGEGLRLSVSRTSFRLFHEVITQTIPVLGINLKRATNEFIF